MYVFIPYQYMSQLQRHSAVVLVLMTTSTDNKS